MGWDGLQWGRRLASIIRKAEAEKGIIVASLKATASIDLQHEAEKVRESPE
jgi:hypothetical protein